jgi:pimeloyl-ACP methyl ester carboxylesterase
MNPSHPLDSTLILENLFYPRQDDFNPNANPDYRDGRLKVEADVSLGYRWYLQPAAPAVLLYFHGNGEIASDCDWLAPFYARCGLSLLVVDYRGYGWSDGSPLTSTLLPDAEQILLGLPSLLEEQGLAKDTPLFIKGRSLGSACAIYLAYKYPEHFHGLILDSAYADTPSLFKRLNIPVPHELLDDESLPLNNAHKLAKVSLPSLILHGENDTVFPLEHATALYRACTNPRKQLVIIHGAGHNDIQVIDMELYFSSIRNFVAEQLT